jgi:hypothetical protein
VLQHQEAIATLIDFRHAVYDQALGHRKDTLFELMEAVLASAGPQPLVHFSLSPAFRRRWPRVPDALTDGTIAPDACRRAVHAHLAAPGVMRPIWAVDGTVWPRPAAQTSAKRTWAHRVNPSKPQNGLVPGWEYQWLVAVPEAAASWVLPLDVRRRGPDAGTRTALASAALRCATAALPPGSPRPVGTLDSGYDAIALEQATRARDPAQRIDADLLVRLVPRRRFYRPPGPYKGTGTHPKHGAVFRLADPATHGPPDHSASGQDPARGRIAVDVWENLHAQWAADTPLAVVRVQAERLPKAKRAPKPLWLAWVGAGLPDDLPGHVALVCAAVHRGAWLPVSQAPPGLDEHPHSGPGGGGPLELALGAGLLAAVAGAGGGGGPTAALGAGVADRPADPVRVRRAFGALSAALGCPSCAPRPRGKATGRRLGEWPGPRERHDVVYRSDKRAA